MQYLHTMIRTQDLDKSLHFFCTLLGLKEFKRVDVEEGRFSLIFLATEQDIAQAGNQSPPLLELTYNWPSEDGKSETFSTPGRAFGHLAYSVENIYETCQKLMDGGVTIHRPPRDGRMAFIKSPEGISVELLQKGEALPTKEPWVNMPNTGTW